MCNAFSGSVRHQLGQWTAEILPGFGMNVISLRENGKPVLREPKDFETLENSPYLHGIPLLFPANRTEGGRFVFGGNTYTLPLNEPLRNNHIHGLMYNAPFTVTEKTASSVTAEYINTSERYPFPFIMTVKDSLSESGFERILTLRNTGGGSMPYTLAFHTAFVSPEKFSAPIERRFLVNEFFIPTGETRPLTPEETAYRSGASCEDRKISGFFTSCGNTVRLDGIVFTVSDNFDEWILFNAGGGQGFFCAEPQAGKVNGLNTENGHKLLMPGEEAEYRLFIGKEHA